MTMPEVMSTKCLIETSLRWAKRQCHINKLAADFDVHAVIAREGMICRLLTELSKLTLYKLWGVRWPIIIGTALFLTSGIPLWDEYDKPFRSSIPKEISLVSSLLQYRTSDRKILSVEPLMQKTKLTLPIPSGKTTDLSTKVMWSSVWRHLVRVARSTKVFRSYVMW